MSPQQTELVEELEFLLSCGVGEHAILAAVGYIDKPGSLQRRLYRIGRLDLIPRAFEWQAEIAQERRPNKTDRYKRKEAA